MLAQLRLPLTTSLQRTSPDKRILFPVLLLEERMSRGASTDKLESRPKTIVRATMLSDHRPITVAQIKIASQLLRRSLSHVASVALFPPSNAPIAEASDFC